jgi:hypothetical protein
MNVRSVGPNQTVLTLNNQDEVFFSYETPVAGWICGKGFWRTTEKFSATTTRHVGRYANTYRVTDMSPEAVELLLYGYGVTV